MHPAYLVITLVFALMVSYSAVGKIRRDPGSGCRRRSNSGLVPCDSAYDSSHALRNAPKKRDLVGLVAW
jgi:hypothetical protein